ncbi:response regulator [bacterium]|nr:response regulator [bacterium]
MAEEVKPFEILLIEDNDDHAAAVKRSFRKHRLENHITHLKDGEEAMNYLFRKGEFEDPLKSPRPKVILLDLRLPKLDGLDILKAIKSDDQLKHLPVVVLTSSRTDQDIEKATELHANSFVVKPVSFDKFVKLMDDLGYYWLGYHTSPLG